MTTCHFDYLSKRFNCTVCDDIMDLLMIEGSDSKCCDRQKRNIVLPSSIKQQHIIFCPLWLRKIALSQQQILLVLPHSIFRHFSYHEKSFSWYSKKNLQFQEESDEESTRADLQPL